MTCYYTEADDTYLAETYSTLTATEQARALGRSYDSIIQRRRRLVARGMVDRQHRAYNPAWSEDERAAVELMLQQGAGVDVIARKVGRSRRGIAKRLRNDRLTIDGMRARRGAHVRTIASIATLFFVGRRAVVIWIARGWLHANRNGVKTTCGYAAYLITDQALIDCINCRDSWVAWQPSQIQDPHWRAYAAEIRRVADGEWVSSVTYARRVHVAPTTVNAWYRRGPLVGIRSIKWNGWRYFWSSDLERVAAIL